MLCGWSCYSFLRASPPHFIHRKTRTLSVASMSKKKGIHRHKRGQGHNQQTPCKPMTWKKEKKKKRSNDRVNRRKQRREKTKRKVKLPLTLSLSPSLSSRGLPSRLSHSFLLHLFQNRLAIWVAARRDDHRVLTGRVVADTQHLHVRLPRDLHQCGVLHHTAAERRHKKVR